LNWRCPRNPKAGGAEILTFDIARRLVAGGDEVEWFSASFPGAPAEEELDGVRLVRAGRQWTVHWHAFRHYRGGLRNRFDIVIDEVNTLPFFTPLWADIPKVMLIYQLAREVWWYEAPFPLNAIGYAVEPLYLSIYRSQPVLTISKSTEQSLVKLGLKGPIEQIPVGIDQAGTTLPEKSAEPTFLYVGRLAPSKRIPDILKAFAVFAKSVPTSRLLLIGDGRASYKRSLSRLAHRLDISDQVTLVGRVSSQEKYLRMAQAFALLMASVREGWGLAVTEANSCGTPAIVYDVPGLRDSVRSEETGLVVEPSPRALAQGMLRLWHDRVEYNRLASAALEQSRRFSYAAATQALRQHIVAVSGSELLARAR
jgi:glycosyltransferase involved in cell wall biosynthesis